MRLSEELRQRTKRFASAVIQLYVKHLKSALEHPIQELRGFKRVAFQPGEQKTVEIPLTAKSLAYWDENKHAWTVESGTIEIRVGSSSADERLKTIVTVE